MAETADLNGQMQRVEELVQVLETTADPNLRAQALELVQTLMDFHGAAIDRMMEITEKTGAAGYAIFDDFAKDNLVSNLLLLYDLHPLNIEARIAGALEKVRPSLNLHEGNVELLGIKDGVVKLRLQGNCDGCPSSAMTLKTTIEEAIYAAAPDVAAVEVENLIVAKSPNGLVQISKAQTRAYTDCDIAVS